MVPWRGEFVDLKKYVLQNAKNKNVITTLLTSLFRTVSLSHPPGSFGRPRVTLVR